MLFLIFILVLGEVIIIMDAEAPIEIKIFCSFILLPIIIICLIKLISNFILRKNKVPTTDAKEEKISVDEWNYNQTIRFGAEDRTIYNEEINAELGEKRTFIRRTDEYGNSVLINRNDNIVDWIAVLLFGIGMNIVALGGLFYNKLTIFYMLIILLISVLLTIYSVSQINKIRKLKLKVSFFQIVKLIFIVTILIIVFGALFIINMGLDLSKIDVEKIFLLLFSIVMGIGIFAFIYQMTLFIKVCIKEIKQIKEKRQIR